MKNKPKTNMEALINLQDSIEPEIIHVSPEINKFLTNPDALSQDMVIFRNDGTVNNEKTIPFVRLTPELSTLLQMIFKK